ncbi:MAG: hypothetical protein ED557_06445 [Balneola sp.]|nr:MAG: hypothetical protein ED557_06445 [Balneola sp.]
MRKNWLWYQTFRYPIVKFGLHLFYKRIIIEGKERLPKKAPILFVPNHQNSFMDALLVVTHVNPFIYFLTRAQAFNPPLMGKFLRSLNMLPVYRVRDGLSSVTKNNAIFDQCIEYMKRDDAILVFPEANHDLRRRVRPLSKGFTRIAFDAEVREGWNMNLHVIPVGLNYEEHRRSRNSVRVVFGEPILMKKYKELFEKDEREATAKLKEEVSEGIKKTIMHVPNLDHYPAHKILLDDLEKESEAVINPKIVNKRVEELESHLNPEIVETATTVYEIAEKNDFSIKSIAGRKKPVLSMVLFFPFYLFSWFNNLIPYQPVRRITTKLIKDHAFDASIKFILGMILFPVFWLLISLILWIAGVPDGYIQVYIGLSLMTSILFKDANLMVREAKERKRVKEFAQSHPEKHKQFEEGLKKLNEFRSKVFAYTEI